MDAIKINVAASKNKQGCGGRSLGSLNTRLSAGETPGGPDLINPSTFFFFFWLAAVENEAVATFERAFQQDEYAFALNLEYLAQIDASFLAESRVDQCLVVVAAKPARV